MKREIPEPAVVKSVESKLDKPIANIELDANFKGRVVGGGIITVALQAIRFILQFGSSIILARLLSPEDFGLFVMVIAFTGYLALFRDGGLSVATVQREEINQQQISSLFWINVALGITLALLVLCLAPALVWFYQEPRLRGIAILISISFLITGMTVQPQALLRRQMRFGVLAVINTVSMASGICVAIVLAAIGYQYWALVWQIVITATVTAILVFSVQSWRPDKPYISKDSLPLLKFGGSLTISLALNQIIQSIDQIVIGRLMGSSPLGLYAQARKLLVLPSQLVATSITGVAVPSLSRAISNEPTFRRLFLNAVGITASVSMPPIAFMIMYPEDLLVFLFGDQWRESSPFVRILGIGYYLTAVHSAPGWLCIATDSVKKQLHWSLISTPLFVIGIVVGGLYSARGIAIAFTTGWTVAYYALAFMACRNSPISFYAFISCLVRSSLPSVIAGIITFSLFGTRCVSTSELATSCAVFGILTILFMLLFPSQRNRLFLIGNTVASKVRQRA